MEAGELWRRVVEFGARYPGFNRLSGKFGQEVFPRQQAASIGGIVVPGEIIADESLGSLTAGLDEAVPVITDVSTEGLAASADAEPEYAREPLGPPIRGFVHDRLRPDHMVVHVPDSLEAPNLGARIEEAAADDHGAAFIMFDRIGEPMIAYGGRGTPAVFTPYPSEHEVGRGRGEVAIFDNARLGDLTLPGHEKQVALHPFDYAAGGEVGYEIARTFAMENRINANPQLFDRGIRAARMMGTCRFTDRDPENNATYDMIGYFTEYEPGLVTLNEYLWGDTYPQTLTNRLHAATRLVDRAADLFACLHADALLFAPNGKQMLMDPAQPKRLLLTELDTALTFAEADESELFPNAWYQVRACLGVFTSQIHAWTDRGYISQRHGEALIRRFNAAYRMSCESQELSVPDAARLLPGEIIGL